MIRVISVAYKLLILLLSIGIVVGLFNISRECNKVYREVRNVRMVMSKVNKTASDSTKKVVDEITATREEGTKVRIWFW